MNTNTTYLDAPNLAFGADTTDEGIIRFHDRGGSVLYAVGGEAEAEQVLDHLGADTRPLPEDDDRALTEFWRRVGAAIGATLGAVFERAEQARLAAHLVAGAILGEIESDTSCGADWRNGTVFLPDGDPVDMGGGWIETPESADRANEEAGIAGGLRQGVSYPNEVVAGQFTPYAYGEDESGWQRKIMPLILGDDWENAENADEIARQLHAAVQTEMKRIADGE